MRARPRVELGHQLAHHHRVDRFLDLVVVLARRRVDRAAVVVDARAERGRPVRRPHVEGIEDLVDRGRHRGRQFVGARLATEAHGERRGRRPERGVEVLGAPRDVHRPGRVAEVAAELTGHGRTGERPERHPAVGVEALDGLEHADPRDLDEVVDRLAATAESHRLPAGEVEVVLDESVPDRRVTGAAIGAEPLQRLGRISGHERRRTPARTTTARPRRPRAGARSRRR